MRERRAALNRRLDKWRGSMWFPVLLAVGAVLAAAILHIAVALIPGTKDTFPFAFFYLIAVFAAAWLGGSIAGVIGCVMTMVAIPLAVSPEFRLANLDLTRLGLFSGVSLLVSWVAKVQRRMQQRLRDSNQELDRRVEARTADLANAVALLRSEIDERKKTERALRESEQRVDWTLDAASIGRWDLDLASGNMSRSARYDQVLGHETTPVEWTYEAFLSRLHPDDRQSVAERLLQARESGEPFELDTRIVRADGEERWVWVQGRALRDNAGAASSMLGSVHDITPRKVAEKRLHMQLARLNLLDHITRGIGERQDLRSIFQVVVRSLEDNLPIDFGCICLYDQANASLQVTCVGLQSGELAMELAMTEHSTIPVDANGLSRCVGGQLVYEQDVTLLDFPLSKRIAQGGLHSFVAAPLLVANEVFGVLIAARKQPRAFASGDCEFLRQLSEHVALAANQARIRAALQQAYDDLQKSQQTVMQQERLRALGQMASGIAHDINNAISPVMLYTESLLESEPNLSARAREYLETTQRSIEDVAETVSRLREFYRHHEPQLVLSGVHVGTLARQVLDLTAAHWRDLAQKRGVTIRAVTDLAPDVPAVSGIESEIREALTNLVLNAVDAMPNGGELTVRTRLMPASGKTPEVYVEVIDTGQGMDDATRQRCLEPFFTTKGERGTGLGLAMVYGVLQRHNGRIELESAPGRGTTVRLIFPVPEKAAAAREPLNEPAPSRQHLRILVVDDDPLLIKSLCDTLRADGHTVTAANGGDEGIRVFQMSDQRDKPFSVVITDLGMPYTDGRKVAGAVKAKSPSTPVILLTGWGQRLIAEGDAPPDVDCVLSKPPKLRDLRTALSKCMEKEPAPAPGRHPVSVGSE
jgi:signal transduction histidine kinase/PAS domain-containing protein/ActR/RegA family two-component response regulator